MENESFTKTIRDKGTKGITQAIIYVDKALMEKYDLNIGDKVRVCKE